MKRCLEWTLVAFCGWSLWGCGPSDGTATGPANPMNGSANESTATSVNGTLTESTTDIVPSAPSNSATSKTGGLLTIGSVAPALNIDHWLKGKPVAKFAADQVYVVEFWATWCPPCKASMPHLSKLQKQYGNKVRFIGVTAEPLAEINEFLATKKTEEESWDQVVQYTLAVDHDGVTNQSWLEAAGQTGIPCAFVVGRDGRIEWIGHPMEMDEPLQAIVAGTWDRAAALTANERKLEQQRKEDERQQVLNAAFEKKDWETLLKLADEMLAESPDNLQYVDQKLYFLVTAGKQDEAQKFAEQSVEKVWDNHTYLNAFAWNMAMGETPGGVELALKAAKRACELTKNEDAGVIDTLARVYFQSGQLADAITWQKKAIEQAPDEMSFKDTLKEYEAALAEKTKEANAKPSEEKVPDEKAPGK